MSTVLSAKIRACTACGLHSRLVCTAPVPFHGKPSPIMIVGEAPGRNEDAEGRPFVGMAGKLLWENLSRFDLGQTEVFVANAVCCYPSRTPTSDEIYACRSNLYKQVKFCNPRFILALGRTANSSFGREDIMRNLHGNWYVLPWFNNRDDEEIMIMATYHPAAVLRDRTMTKAWRLDLKSFVEIARA